MSVNKIKDQYRGCLLGGGIGDALGWPVEFLKYKEIIRKYGTEGITDLKITSSGFSEITDDTQMTLFTAEGLLRAETRGRNKGICHIPTVVYFAYQRWLYTQGYPKIVDKGWIYDGCLMEIKELHHQRAPGNSCLSALAKEELGTVEQPINNSKGCGGVMRIAPIGLVFPKEMAFKMAVDCAALTHGHPSGYLSAGTLAYIIAELVEGEELEDAITNSLLELKKNRGHEECSTLIEKAIELSTSETAPLKAITKLGEGWVGEEALAISIYCALKYKNSFDKALITAVNHDGDSDSTGTITGNILGAYLGINQIPSRWVKKVEMSSLITQLADDLLIRYSDSEEWWDKYPGY
ncbi:ADP-ribosylglycohydrolase family protein [Litchfieldia alkalitelluris]|uniref:ADP-ribosylglycohydrolase family protein n=1 Tax=Litchfieldia alkalitelluris TaxID=304268 RepID=UPI000997BD0D|nr:ADP-ribosylglycohydrolase family protein [Litchfieldia alkalitelluris]